MAFLSLLPTPTNPVSNPNPNPREAYAEMMAASSASCPNVDDDEVVEATICGSFRRERDSSGDVYVQL